MTVGAQGRTPTCQTGFILSAAALPTPALSAAVAMLAQSDKLCTKMVDKKGLCNGSTSLSGSDAIYSTESVNLRAGCLPSGAVPKNIAIQGLEFHDLCS